MTEFQKEYLGNCLGIFDMLEDCINEKRSIELSDTGLLKFTYIVKRSRNNEVTKTLDFGLKEVEISDHEKLVMRVERLER
jgi:hypothetical protein